MNQERCKHGMVPAYCSICTGLVTAANQTREYGEDDTRYEPDMPDVPPEVWNQTGNLEDLVEDLPPNAHPGRPKAATSPCVPGQGREPERRKEHTMSDVKLCKACGKEKVVAQGFGIRCYDKWRHGRLEGDWPPFQHVRNRTSAKTTETAKPRTPPKPRNRKPAIEPDTPIPYELTEKGKASIILDLREYPEILQGLREAARRQIRTLEHQAIACVHLYLVQENLIPEATT